MRILFAVLIMTGWMQAQTQDFAPPPAVLPEPATLKLIQEKTAELAKALEACKDTGHYAEVAVYHKAAVWIQKHNEWYSTDKKNPKNVSAIAKQTLTVLDAGLARAKAKEPTWRNERNKPIGMGYKSEIDGSFQPYRVTLPEGFGKDGKKYRLDIVLHGRNATLTEVGFLAACETAKPGKPLDYVMLEVYGRGNNAYRWAGETDVHDAVNAFNPFGSPWIDRKQIVIRGFSMGGAGTWHLGLHHPFRYAAMSPGAGFTVTRGYIKDFGQQPDYIERCLRIYDSADYAENLFNIPCVAYSGELDKQRAAVENVEARLKNFKLPLRYTHIIGTGLEHKQPPEWWNKVNEKIEAEIQLQKANEKEFASPFRYSVPSQVRFVTYYAEYGNFAFGKIHALENQYDKTIVDAIIDNGLVSIKTNNVRCIEIFNDRYDYKIDGALFPKVDRITGDTLIKLDGVWKVKPSEKARPKQLMKSLFTLGPIDHAFVYDFSVISPVSKPWHHNIAQSISIRQTSFEKIWDKYFRGTVRHKRSIEDSLSGHNYVLFGDPASNPVISEVMPSLPIKWTRTNLNVNGKDYDAASHFPTLVYPNREGNGYIVLNSGHTFGEDALKGTNALLYPRLGDWAVMKVVPGKEPEVVDAGIFDSNWQFEKK